MALTFPSSPTNGQIYADTTTGNRYIYNATVGVWSFAANNVGMSVSSTPPANVAPGAMWFNREIGRTFVYYDDGDSKQWIETVPAGAVDTNTIASYVNPVFASMNGAYTTANAAFGVANTALQNTSSAIFAGTSANATLLNNTSAASYMVLKGRENSYNLNTTTTGSSAYLKWLDGGGSPRGTPGNTANSYGSTGTAASTTGILLEYDPLYNAGEAGTYKLQMQHNTAAGYPLWYRTQSAGNWTNWYSFVQANYLGNVGIGTSSPSARIHLRQDQDGVTRQIIQNRNASGTPISELSFITGALDLTDSRYAYIQSAGAGSTYLAFGTSNAGAPTERMRIDSSGRVTKPYTPLVCASFNSNAVWLNYNNNPTTVIFNDASLMNNGGYYNTSTGIFTCPVTGLYRVSSGALMGNASHAFIYMYKNSTNVGHVVHHNPASGTGYMTCGGEWMVSCSANDTLKIVWLTGNGGGIYGGGYNYFNVELIG